MKFKLNRKTLGKALIVIGGAIGSFAFAEWLDERVQKDVTLGTLAKNNNYSFDTFTEMGLLDEEGKFTDKFKSAFKDDETESE